MALRRSIRNFRRTVVLLTAVLAGTLPAGRCLSSDRPNILIFMADDQYRSSVGCYGAKPSHTPHIDRLATEGLRFHRCFSPSSMCTPNRAAMLSGMLPLKNGAHPNHSGFYDGIRSLPNFMKQLGYRTALFNKDGIRKSSDLYRWDVTFRESDHPLPGAAAPPIRRHLASRFDEIEKVIGSDDPRPFCLLHASRLPHTPHLGRLANGLEGYDASNFMLDAALGRDLELLEKHKQVNSTIVIYVNDNEANQPRTKYTLYDTGVLVACVVRWPGKIHAATTSDAMVSFLDFLPTLVEIAGGRPDPNWDGRSMLDVWRGKTDRHHDGLYFSYTGVTLGRPPQTTPYPIRAFRTQRYKYIRYLNHAVGHPKQNGQTFPPEELFDLQADPNETTNLADDRQHAGVKAQLSDQVDEWMRRTDDRGIASEIAALRRYGVEP